MKVRSYVVRESLQAPIYERKPDNAIGRVWQDGEHTTPPNFLVHAAFRVRIPRSSQAALTLAQGVARRLTRVNDFLTVSSLFLTDLDSVAAR